MGSRLDMLPGWGGCKNIVFGKTTITFAYKLRLRRFLYKSSSIENFEYFSVRAQFLLFNVILFNSIYVHDLCPLIF